MDYYLHWYRSAAEAGNHRPLYTRSTERERQTLADRCGGKCTDGKRTINLNWWEKKKSLSLGVFVILQHWASVSVSVGTALALLTVNQPAPCPDCLLWPPPPLHSSFKLPTTHSTIAHLFYSLVPGRELLIPLWAVKTSETYVIMRYNNELDLNNSGKHGRSLTCLIIMSTAVVYI